MRTISMHIRPAGAKKKRTAPGALSLLATGAAASAALIAAFAAIAPQARAQDENSTSVSLAGAWLEHSGDNDNWRRVEAPETDWQKVQLPGASTTAGFTWYRKHFSLPADWSESPLAKQNRLYLHLGGLHGAAAIYINNFLINTVGKLPSNASGSGYQPVAATHDLTLEVPISAAVQGGASKEQQVFNFSSDNVLAIRVYDPTAEPNPQGGALKVDLPTTAELFPVSTSASAADHLYENKARVAVTVAFTNDTSADANAAYSVNILSDSGSPIIAPPTPKPIKLNAGQITKEKPDFDLAGAGVPPGFYTFVVTSTVNDAKLDPEALVAGVDPSEIRSNMTAPNGFGAFWNAVKSEADAGSLSPQINKDAAASTPDVNVYRVQFAGMSGQPALAWLSVPANVGAKPVAVLHIPAYKEDPKAPSLDIARRGYIVMDLIANAPDYTTGNAGIDYFSTGLESPQNYIFRRIEGNVLRAARLLSSAPLPGVTGSPKLVLWGESVGGALAMDSAALLKQNVAGVVAISPYFSDIARTLSNVDEAANPFHAYIQSHPNSRPQVNATLGSFDTVQFAPKITAPTFVAVGLEDPIALPAGEYAAINLLTAPHTVDVEPDAQHIPSVSHDKALNWLDKTVK